jgi:hypothetical protein
MRRLLPLLPALGLLLSCSGGDGSTQLPTTLPPTTCASDAPTGQPVVRVAVVDPTDGAGSMSLVAQGDVAAGTVRLVVEADATNADVTRVVVTRDATEVAEVRGVAAGDTCGIDVQLAAGQYTAASGGRSVAFTVVAP